MAGRRNLTQHEAAARAAVVAANHYDITLDLSNAADAATFACRTVVRFACRDMAATTMIDVAAQALRSAVLNRAAVDLSAWSRDAGRLTLSGLAADNTLEIEGEFAFTTSGEGLHRFVDPADGRTYLYTQMCVDHAPSVFACFDQPDLKAEFTWHVTVPDGWHAVSNMPVESSHDAPGGGRVVHFKRSPRMSTYVVALCAGPFHAVQDDHNGVELGLYCRAAAAGDLDADDLLLITKQGLDLYGDRLGQPYPLPKYDQVMLPEFNAGGMENFGCTVYAESLMIFRDQTTESDLELRAMVQLHELAHMWFGDLVTLRWWDDLWLNESFAEWAAFSACETATRFTDAWATFLITRKQWGYEQDQLSSTHPVFAEAPDVRTAELNFDGITYAKGASVLKQLVAYVGVDAFLAGVRRFLAQNAWGNATFADLVASVEQAGGRPLRDVADAWLRTAQVSTLRPVVRVDGDGLYTEVVIEQETPPEHPASRTHRVAVGLYDVQAESLVRRHRLMLEVTGARTPVPELTGIPRADVLLVNDDDLTYAKIRLDDRSAATLVGHVGGFKRPLQRALAWAAAWDMTKDAELAGRTYIRQVVAGLPAEDSAAIIDSVLPTARRTVATFVDPAWQPEGWRLLHDAAGAAMRAATPAGDRQLLWARLHIESAHTPEQADAVLRWLDGRDVPEGLTVDRKLRWHLLRHLAAVGAVTSEQILAQLADDDTADGREQAAWARAALPAAHNKEQVWQRVTGGPDIPHWELVNLLHGFHHSTQATLLAPYADRYFTEVADVYARLDNALGREFATAAFPQTQINEQTVAAADAWLAEAHPESLRRLVGEGRDRMLWALRARRRDAGIADGPGMAGPAHDCC